MFLLIACNSMLKFIRIEVKGFFHKQHFTAIRKIGIKSMIAVGSTSGTPAINKMG